MSDLTLEEMETAITCSGVDRSNWDIYSDDPVMQKRLEKAGATLIRASRNGEGKYYTMRAEQILFRPGKREMSEAQKVQLAKARAIAAGNSAPAEVEGPNRVSLE